MGQLLDCLGIRQPEGGKGDEEDGEGPRDSVETMGVGCSSRRGFLSCGI